MKKSALFIFTIWFHLLLTGVAFAEEHSLGSIATDLMGPADVITRLVHLICIIVGFTLIVVAISFYKAHRFNPKFVPLERPIIIALLGIFLIVLPFYGKIFHPTGGTHDAAAVRGIHTGDPDAPLEGDWGNDYNH